MSVKKEPSGRRSVELRFEVPGTPEQLWQAIATERGLSAWFVPATFEEENGKPTAVTLHFGPGQDSRSTVTAWEPLKQFNREGPGWVPGSPPIATEFTIEAHAGGTCTLRIVQSLFASTDDWDAQLTGAEEGWPGIARILQLYIQHFAGQRAANMQQMAAVAGTPADAWAAVTGALGLQGVEVGQRFTAPAGVPALGGLVVYRADAPYGALLRLDSPGPGVVAIGTIEFGDTVMATIGFYLYGDGAAEIAARETPKWQAWMQERFPMPGA